MMYVYLPEYFRLHLILNSSLIAVCVSPNEVYVQWTATNVPVFRFSIYQNISYLFVLTLLFCLVIMFIYFDIHMLFRSKVHVELLFYLGIIVLVNIFEFIHKNFYVLMVLLEIVVLLVMEMAWLIILLLVYVYLVYLQYILLYSII